MLHRKLLPFCVVLASFFSIAGGITLRAQDDDSHHGRKYKAPPPSSTISVTVVRGYNGKPIPGAHVIFHPIEGDKDKGALELKTNDDGKAVIDVIPLGDTVTLQVIANGFQTYGQIYKIDKLNMAMEVRMNRPTEQYSIYKNSDDHSGAGNNSGAGNGSGSSDNSGGRGSGDSSGSGDKSGSGSGSDAGKSNDGKSSGAPPNSPPPDSGKSGSQGPPASQPSPK